MVDLTAEIRRQFAAATAKWGDTFELQMLRNSWGDTMDVEEMLAALVHFQTSGRYLESIMAIAHAPVRPMN